MGFKLFFLLHVTAMRITYPTYPRLFQNCRRFLKTSNPKKILCQVPCFFFVISLLRNVAFTNIIIIIIIIIFNPFWANKDFT